MANSEVVTREDLKNVFEALGEGDYETRIDNIEETLTAPFITRTYTQTGIRSSTWYTNISINIAVDGYTPVAFKGLTFNQADKHAYWFHFVNDTTASIGIALNQNSGTISGTNVTIIVLYIKSDLLG